MGVARCGLWASEMIMIIIMEEIIINDYDNDYDNDYGNNICDSSL